jgi:hypothetical protein
MKKSTVVTVLSLILLLGAIAAGFNAVLASRSYVECAARLTSEATAGDRMPPERFHRFLRAIWGKRDVYLARVLERECAQETGSALRRFGSQMTALGSIKARLPADQRESLAAIFIPGKGGRGLTRSAQTEWGRPPEALDDAEMTWLFVVALEPSCSRAGVVPEEYRKFCADTYERQLSRAGVSSPQHP